MSYDSSRSAANTSRKSKRGLDNSNSSNNKNSKQKTLGMAWGPTLCPPLAPPFATLLSPISAGPLSLYYMAEKNRKLQHQFEAEASTSSHSGSSPGKLIFQGVYIFIDGFTIPSNQELRAYMLKYGGRFANYFSRHQVTHIICSNLPDSKIKNLRSFSGGLPVVKPAWILDSIAANKLLSWIPYQLNQLANNQPKLSAFFTLKSNPVLENVLTDEVCQVKQDPFLKGGTTKDACISKVDEPIRFAEQAGELLDDPNHQFEELNTSSGKSSEVKMVEFGSSDAEDGNSVNSKHQSGPGLFSASASGYCLHNQSSDGSLSSEPGGPSNRHHSTLGDPNFVENYFKSSRLHFIGTWRSRYRKRFPSSSSELKCRSSDLNTSANSDKSTIIHVDMDCFFVSVVIRNHPELHDKPVAVCHSDNPKGTAEISSANYPARNYGVKAGIFVRDAKALCPQLVIIPYNFKAYEEVADQFYSILHKHCHKVQAISCDEAFLDITEKDMGDPELLASTIRKEIFNTTRCTASVGIAGNMLMARLATGSAKPNGQCYIPSVSVDEFLYKLPIKALPGIGHVLEEKLKKQNVWTCGQLRLISKESLQKDFGLKTGEMLWNYSRGVDNRLVGNIKESKTIGAEVNWGVRFKDLQDSQCFLLNLCKEVSFRLQGCGVQGRTFTLKIKKRRKDADEPVKYMGCGDCENLSHSMTVSIATDDVKVLQRITKQLFGSFCLDVKDIRGVGLQVSKLENADPSKQAPERNSLRSWLTSTTTEKAFRIDSMAKERARIDSEVKNLIGTSGQLFSDHTGFSAQVDSNSSSDISAPPPLSHLDMGVVKGLPAELFSELNEIYGGKLTDFIAKSSVASENIYSYPSTHSAEGQELAVDGGEGPLASDMIPLDFIMVENRAKQHMIEEEQAAPSWAGLQSEAICSVSPNNNDLMPLSLSQVDVSVLQQLPEELRGDILGQLPAHRKQELTSNAGSHLSENPEGALNIKITENQSNSTASVLNSNLWSGSPPQWVDKFTVSSCLILKTLAELYCTLGSTGSLSPILQRIISECLYPLDENSDACGEEATYDLCELFKQYVKLKMELDLEEIYVCFCLLKRLTTKSKFFLQVYDIVFPYLQASVGENYGGGLHI
ncbi:DNA repair protein [Salix suchowensis]|nr:DNA repair protein [Salix suchowensis]